MALFSGVVADLLFSCFKACIISFFWVSLSKSRPCVVGYEAPLNAISLNFGHLENEESRGSKTWIGLNSLPGENVVWPWADMNFSTLKFIDLSSFELNEAALSENSSLAIGGLNSGDLEAKAFWILLTKLDGGIDVHDVCLMEIVLEVDLPLFELTVGCETWIILNGVGDYLSIDA